MTDTKTTQPLVHWMLCADSAYGPFTQEAAERKAEVENTATFKGHCTLTHRVVTSGVKPSTAAQLETFRAIFDTGYIGDPGDEVALAEWRGTVSDLADAILRAPLNSRVGGLVIYTGGWSKERGEDADRAGEAGSPAWIKAMGAYEYATLTGDGKAAVRTAWCECPGLNKASEWVRYEHWTAEGMTRHGFVCGTCRKLTQTG